MRNTFNDLSRRTRALDSGFKCHVAFVSKWNVRVASDAVLSAKLALVDAVNLGDLDVLLGKLGRSFLVLGSECLAVSTP